MRLPAKEGALKLASKVAIVTGAGRNVGEEVACALVAEGANVALVDNNQERLDRAVEKASKAG